MREETPMEGAPNAILECCKVCTNQPKMQKQLDQMTKLIGGEKVVEDLLEKWPILQVGVLLFLMK